MKILLIDPPGEQKGINAGLAYLSGALTASGMDHAVLDMVNGDPGDERLIATIRKLEPQCVGVSMKTATYVSSLHVVEVVKRNFPKLTVIAGGPHASLYGAELLGETPHIDALIGYDAETGLPWFLREWDGGKTFPDSPGIMYRKDGTVVSVPPEIPRDLDALPLPELDKFMGLDLSGHRYPLVTSRGCPHGCIYCSVGRVSGKKWRGRSALSVVKELERARDKYDFSEFDVLDDTFTHDVARAMEICGLLIGRGLGMRWSCPNGIRADRVTPELLAAMKRAGCHTVIFGVESGDPAVFDGLRKGEKLDDVERAVTMARSAGMRVGGYFIIGLPGDSYEGTVSSLEYARRIGLDWAHFNLLAPYPGTKVWDMIAEKGRFLDDWKTTRHFGSEPRPVFDLEGFSADDMVRAYRTVHVRQKLYHLVLPEGLDDKQRKSAIRKLRMEHDRDEWIGDIRLDFHTAVVSMGTVARAAVRGAVSVVGSNRDLVESTASKSVLDPRGRRVLMVNDHGGAAGGTEKYIFDTISELAKRGVECGWCYEREGEWRGGNFRRYGVRGLWNADASRKNLREDLHDAIRNFRPDIIHMHNVQSPEAMTICAKAAPTVRTVHDHNFTCPSMNRMRATGRICHSPTGLACFEALMEGGCSVIGRRPLELARRLDRVLDGLASSKKLDKILVASEFMGRELVANGIRADKVTVNPLYVDFPEVVEKKAHDGVLRLLWVGRLVMPDKGPDLFLDVLSRLRNPFEAVMAGSGPAMDFLVRKKMELGLDGNVKLAGFMDPAELDRQYRLADVVVFTSVWPEPFGYVAIEAAAHGKPVVAFKAGAVDELVENGGGGIVIKRGHTSSMALWLDTLGWDREMAASMGEKNRRRAMEKFNVNRHMEDLLEVYGEVLGR